MLQTLLEKMKASAKSHPITSNLLNQDVQKLLSIENLPSKDVPQGQDRCYQSLAADTSEVAKYIHGFASGSKLYMPGDYLCWHTNSNHPGTRVYFTYVEEPGCWFRYVKNNEAITLTDVPGWNIRAFHITRKNPLWHCVYAGSKRYSFGFNCDQLIDELKPFLINPH